MSAVNVIQERKRYRLELQEVPGQKIPAEQRLRALLKQAKRRHGFDAISVEQSGVSMSSAVSRPLPAFLRDVRVKGEDRTYPGVGQKSGTPFGH